MCWNEVYFLPSECVYEINIEQIRVQSLARLMLGVFFLTAFLPLFESDKGNLGGDSKKKSQNNIWK